MDILYICTHIIVLLEGNSESSKSCDMAASMEVPPAVPVGGAVPSTNAKDYLTDEELFCDESQPPAVCMYFLYNVSSV